MKITSSLVVLGSLLMAAGAQADVQETGENTFTIVSTASAHATPAQVYEALGKVSEWWNSEHTWSGSAKNLTLELQAGGCFCETLAAGGSVQHGRVIFVQPGVMVRLDTPLGPLQEMPVSGILTFKLAPQDGGTQISMTYRVFGAFTLESAKLAPIVDQVMRNQLERLAAYAGGKSPK
jgi:Polyketide cyclase / dehydrase and lipid transport